jgi:flagellar biosynthesis protein FlhF
MRLKLFRAATMAEAMAQVRIELGADALILGNRRIAGGVEVTAALEPPLPPAPEPGRDDVLAWHGVPLNFRDKLATGPLPGALRAALLFAELPLARPLLVIGPPGAGKTLTVVRLATRLVMAGLSPLVLSADGRRAGAMEQLLAFTRLLGLAVTAVDDPLTLGRVVARRAAGTAVLIDTAGIDPFDAAQTDELRSFAVTAGAAIALVLPAGLDASEAADVAAALTEAGADCLVATRLDLARRLGGIIAAAAAARLPLTEAGIGSGAADGLVPLTADLLADYMMRKRNHGPS